MMNTTDILIIFNAYAYVIFNLNSKSTTTVNLLLTLQIRVLGLRQRLDLLFRIAAKHFKLISNSVDGWKKERTEKWFTWSVLEYTKRNVQDPKKRNFNENLFGL